MGIDDRMDRAHGLLEDHHGDQVGQVEGIERKEKAANVERNEHPLDESSQT